MRAAARFERRLVCARGLVVDERVAGVDLDQIVHDQHLQHTEQIDGLRGVLGEHHRHQRQVPRVFGRVLASRSVGEPAPAFDALEPIGVEHELELCAQSRRRVGLRLTGALLSDPRVTGTEETKVIEREIAEVDVGELTGAEMAAELVERDEHGLAELVGAGVGFGDQLTVARDGDPLPSRRRSHQPAVAHDLDRSAVARLFEQLAGGRFER